MIDDPKRPIENELEAWAKARREDAGPPFELHPFSRRLLHEEVARVHPLPAQQELHTEPEPAGSFWARSWRSLAVGLTVVFALVMVVLVYRPSSEPTNDFLMTKSEALDDIERRAHAAPAENDELTLKAQQVMQAAQQQTLAGQQAPAGFFDQASGQSVQLAGNASETMTVRSGGVVTDAVTLARVEPQAAPAPATVSGTISMEPAAAAKVAVLNEAPTMTNANVPGATMSFSLSPTEASAREAELELLAKALRQSNEEINRELSQMRFQQSADAAKPMPATATASRSVALKVQSRANNATTADSDAGRPVVAMSFGGGTAPAPAAPVVKRSAARAMASAPAEPKPTVPALSSTLSIRQQFTQAATRSTLRRNFNSPPTVQVLQNFTVENTGSAVRIVDEDGSVYTGALEVDPTASSDLNRFPFSAVGLNRTLDVQVRFKGALEAASDGALQVRGRASVGIRTELEIDARPATAP